MKIKEVSAGVKVSKNYNSYSINLVADLENEEIAEKVGEELIKRAEKIVFDKIASIEKNNFKKERFVGKKIGGKEVGAAWFSKKSKEVLSVKNSLKDNWEDVNIKDLEKTEEGYERKTSEGILIFKRIPEEKRTNKMPVFRIYKKRISNEKNK